jgi:hypothetical protein
MSGGEIRAAAAFKEFTSARSTAMNSWTSSNLTRS